MSIDCVEFTERYYSDSSEQIKNDVARFVKSFNATIETQDQLADKVNVCKLFYSQTTGNISRSHYQKIKAYLLNVFDYLGESYAIPTREDVLNSQDSCVYFRSLDSLLDFIDEIGKIKIPMYNPTADLVRVKGVCIFGWLGLQTYEIATIKKTDLTMIGYDTYHINTCKGEFEIKGKPFAALYFLYGLNEYNAIYEGSQTKKVYLKGNPIYLFRTKNDKLETPNGAAIKQILKRFVELKGDGYKAITFRELHKNALFVRLYNESASQPITLSKISEVLGCTTNSAIAYKQQYLQFVEAIETGKI